MNKKIVLMLFALLPLFPSTIFASDLKFDISMTSRERDQLKEDHAAQVLVPQKDIDLIKKTTEIHNKRFFACDEQTMHIAELTKWVLGVAGILGAVIWIFIFWNRKLSREISERRNIEKELQSSENRYRSLCNASFEGIIITDDGVIVEANTVITQIFGYPLSELIGMPAVDIITPKVRDDVKTRILAGHEKAYESVGLTKYGVEFPVEIRAREFIYN